MHKFSLSQLLHEHNSDLEKMSEQFKGRLEDRVLLLRFLAGYSFNLERASKHLESTLQWRTKEGIDSFRSEARKMDQWAMPWANKIFKFFPHMIHYSFCRDGSPLSIDRCGLIDPVGLTNNVKLEEMKEYQLYHLEHKLHMLNKLSLANDKLICGSKIVDFTGLTIGKALHVGGLQYLKMILGTAQTHYPEMLDKLIIVNAPSAFNVLWKVITPILSKRTQSKITVLGKNYQDQLLSHVDHRQLPSWLGGSKSNDPLSESDPHRGFCNYFVGPRTIEKRNFDLRIGERALWEIEMEKNNRVNVDVVFRNEDVEKALESASFLSQENQLLRVSGEFLAEQEGKVILNFDNSGSRFVGKNVRYKIQILDPSS